MGDFLDDDEAAGSSNEPFWVMMRILAVCAAVVLSCLLYRFAKGAWAHYQSGQYSRGPSRAFRFRRGANEAVYQRVGFQDDGDEDHEDGIVDEGYHDAESVASGSSRKSSLLLLQKPLPERPLPDKPLPPVPQQSPEE